MSKSIVKNIIVALRANLGGFGSQMASAATSMMSVTNVGKSLAAGMASVGASLAGAALQAVKGLEKMVVGNIETMAATGKLSERLGLSVKALTGLQYAARKAGVDSEQFTEILTGLSERIGLTKQGMGKAGETFAQLGIDAGKLAKLPLDQQFLAVADAISKVPDKATQAAYAAKLFGESGVRLAGLLGMGSVGIRAFMQEADEFGVSFSEIAAQMARKAMATKSKLSAVFEGIENKITEAVLPWDDKLATALTGWIKDSLPWINDMLSTGFDTISGIFADLWAQARTIFEAIGDVLKSFGINFDSTGGVIKTVFMALKGVYDWFAEVSIKVVTFIEACFVNWKDALTVVFAGAALGVVKFAANIQYFFGTVMPAYVNWFGSHWREVFQTMWNFVETFSVNVGKNFVNLFTAIKEFFQGKGWNFKWTGLLEGFENTMTELPKIAARQKGDLEKNLEKVVGDAANNIGLYYDAKVTDRLARLHTDQLVATLTRKTDKDQGKGVAGKIADVAKAALGGSDKKLEFGVLGARVSLAAMAGSVNNDRQAMIVTNTNRSAAALESLNRKAVEGAVVFASN